MSLSKRVFGQIITASAHSDSPIDEEVLREIAEEKGADPDSLIERHREMRKDWEDHKGDKSEPMPVIIP